MFEFIAKSWPNFWKYMVVALVSSFCASLFWVLTDFWKQTIPVMIPIDMRTPQEVLDEAKKKIELCNKYVEEKTAIIKKQNEELEKLNEEFSKRRTREELDCDITNILGIPCKNDDGSDEAVEDVR